MKLRTMTALSVIALAFISGYSISQAKSNIRQNELIEQMNAKPLDEYAYQDERMAELEKQTEQQEQAVLAQMEKLDKKEMVHGDAEAY